MSRKDLLPDMGSVPLSVRQALYRASRDYPGGQFALAYALGVCSNDLCKRVNPKDARPIPAELLEEIVAETRDPRLLAALVRPAGAVAFLPRPAKAEKDSMKSTAVLLNSVSQYIEAMADAQEGNHWQAHEVATLRFHAEQVIDKVLGILAGAEQALEGVEHD